MDAGALEDPFVRGVDDLGQVLVGQDLFGKIGADAGDGGTQHSAHARPSISRPMTSARRSMFWLISVE